LFLPVLNQVPFKVLWTAGAILHDRARLFNSVPDVAVLVPYPAVIEGLTPKEAHFVSPFSRAPQLKVVVIGILDVEYA